MLGENNRLHTFINNKSFLNIIIIIIIIIVVVVVVVVMVLRKVGKEL